MDDAERRRLIELVNDERARRAYAEKELAGQRAETAKWRRRASRAEAAARFSIRLPVREPKVTVAPPPESRPRPVFPAVRAGVSGAPDWLSPSTPSLTGSMRRPHRVGRGRWGRGGAPSLVEWLDGPAAAHRLRRRGTRRRAEEPPGRTRSRSRLGAGGSSARGLNPWSWRAGWICRRRVRVGVSPVPVAARFAVAATMLRPPGSTSVPVSRVTAIAMIKRPDRPGRCWKRSAAWTRRFRAAVATRFRGLGRTSSSRRGLWAIVPVFERRGRWPVPQRWSRPRGVGPRSTTTLYGLSTWKRRCSSWANWCGHGRQAHLPPHDAASTDLSLSNPA